MSTPPPATIWEPTSGNGEYSSSTAENIVDQLDVQLVDPSGVNIVSPDTTFTQLASTTWTENDSI